MKKALMALVAVAALSPAAAAQDSSKDGDKSPFRLGVVNLKTCFEKDKYDRIKEIDADLQKMADAYTKKLQDIEKRMLELKDQIESLPRESPLRADKILQARRAETDYKFEKEYGKTKYLEYYSDRKIEIYNEVRRVVSMIAKDHKFDLVLRVEAPSLEEQDPENLAQRINSRVVLYFNEGVDITDIVLKRLNEEWAKQKVAAGAPAEWDCPVCKKKNKAADAACTATKDCKGKKP
jgi:Skp family chaperone for outer membrane proteins